MALIVTRPFEHSISCWTIFIGKPSWWRRSAWMPPWTNELRAWRCISSNLPSIAAGAAAVNLYRVVQHHLDEFVRQFRWALTSRELFGWHKATPPAALTDIQRAARFFYLQKLAFGAKVEGQTFGTATTSPGRLNLLRMEEDLSAVHLRLHQVTIEHLDWATCVQRYDRSHTLFYLDPPY